MQAIRGHRQARRRSRPHRTSWRARGLTARTTSRSARHCWWQTRRSKTTQSRHGSCWQSTSRRSNSSSGTAGRSPTSSRTARRRCTRSSVPTITAGSSGRPQVTRRRGAVRTITTGAVGQPQTQVRIVSLPVEPAQVREALEQLRNEAPTELVTFLDLLGDPPRPGRAQQTIEYWPPFLDTCKASALRALALLAEQDGAWPAASRAWEALGETRRRVGPVRRRRAHHPGCRCRQDRRGHGRRTTG